MPRKDIGFGLAAQGALFELARMIKDARLDKNWTQVDTARRLDIAPGTYRAIEKGSPTVAIGTVFNACALLQIPMIEPDEQARSFILRYAMPGSKALHPSVIRRRARPRRESGLPDLPGFGHLKKVDTPAEE